MSSWTYINGTVTVCPMGRTQPEKRYILETVLNHLPRVTGSGGDMDVYIIQKNGYNGLCSCDEFGEVTNNLVDKYGYKSRSRGCLRTQDEYILVVNAALRDREFEEIYRDLKYHVEQGDYLYSELLPSENNLIGIYDCSRNTIRRAIAGLVKDGYVQAVHGKGVQVIFQPSEKTNFTVGGIDKSSTNQVLPRRFTKQIHIHRC